MTSKICLKLYYLIAFRFLIIVGKSRDDNTEEFAGVNSTHGQLLFHGHGRVKEELRAGGKCHPVIWSDLLPFILETL